MWALAAYRLSVESLQLSPAPLRPIARAAGQALCFLSGVAARMSISAGAKVGADFHLIHPMNVAISSGVAIGDRVGIMHDVTIGPDYTGGGVPTIGNDVFIGVGATLLGPITVGDRAIIAASSLVITDVPAGAFAVGVPAKVARWNALASGSPSAPSAG